MQDEIKVETTEVTTSLPGEEIKQQNSYRHNLILRRVYKTIVTVEKQ